MDGTVGMSFEGQLPESWALGSHFWFKVAVVVDITLPSPSKMLPAPAGFPAECIFSDHETRPRDWDCDVVALAVRGRRKSSQFGSGVGESGAEIAVAAHNRKGIYVVCPTPTK